MEEQLEKYILLSSEVEGLLGAAVSEFQDELVLAMSFSMEDILLLEKLQGHGFSGRVIALDTGRLPEQVYETADRVAEHFQVKIEWYFPRAEDVEVLLRVKGSMSFRNDIESRKECCRIRKVEPLRRALDGAKAWITGQRREHSPTRELLPVVELDGFSEGRLKFNPIAKWGSNQVKEYTREHDLPYNSLYDTGYVSIGCAPCSRPIRKGEDFRAGRWWWESPDQKECGIHFQDGRMVRGGDSS